MKFVYLSTEVSPAEIWLNEFSKKVQFWKVELSDVRLAPNYLWCHKPPWTGSVLVVRLDCFLQINCPRDGCCNQRNQETKARKRKETAQDLNPSGRFTGFCFYSSRRRRSLSERSDNWVSADRLLRTLGLTFDLHRPSSTQKRRHGRSRNVRGSARTPCPHLTSGIDKRAVVPLLSWLQCLQACRQVVRHKPALRRFNIHSRRLSDTDVKPRAPIKTPVFTRHCYMNSPGEKRLWQLVVSQGNCLLWQNYDWTVSHDYQIMRKLFLDVRRKACCSEVTELLVITSKQI